MTTWNLKHILVIGAILLLGTPGCSKETVLPSTIQPVITLSSTVQTVPRATPYALEPAAGICASFDETAVTIALNADIPDPRCAIVRADQTLTVINKTENTLQVSIASYNFSLAPGESHTIGIPFGDYLEPGVHQLQVLPCCGAELWLKGK